MNILFINGPNLNLLGKREPEIYGHENLDQLIAWVTKQINTKENDIHWFQSNSEGKIIDKQVPFPCCRIWNSIFTCH